MIIHRSGIALGLSALLMSSPISAETPRTVIQSNINGVTLAKLCEKPTDLVLDPCNSYILGAADGLSIGNEICPVIEGWTFIAPRVVRKYIQDNPTVLSEGAGTIVFFALASQYPCNAKS